MKTVSYLRETPIEGSSVKQVFYGASKFFEEKTGKAV